MYMKICSQQATPTSTTRSNPVPIKLNILPLNSQNPQSHLHIIYHIIVRRPLTRPKHSAAYPDQSHRQENKNRA
ncbi:hypothetical protein BDV41DRAFT_551140 [Aspergillus transmontanensis]|uniref:Uncharacterized protein n=1 Tax=Aspergillus transmontanensis TaxID=1034304 RepID=A0A5N6VJN6_9EURO|nr:hypothetical protein BDV41DRAFT_551140 [Aspergillus transmontanensis]